MSAESPRHARSGGPLTVPSRPPSDRGLIDAVSGFLNDVTLSSVAVDPKDVIQWARFETADINEPTPEGDSDDISPLLLILGYGSGVQVWLIPPTGEAQEVLSWRQGTVRVLRILPTPQHGDSFASKRPLIALCDSASPGPPFCSLSFISIRGGEQVKSIKFKNPILDVLANKRSVVISFSERFAIFDAATLEDRMAVTTCYPCPCPLGGSLPINPLALGDRWLAYADKKLNQSKRSSGGCEGEGVTSYTATVLHAAKSLSKGLRGLGESVAHSLAGGRSTSQSPSPPNADIQQPGVVTILDIEGIEEEDGLDTEEPCDPIVAHFVAHSEAIIALKFDPSGMLLVTADRRGHDFHVFRVHPHPCGPGLAAVHHLYILHRGDTTAKVQDIAISADSRWAAVSTLRGTTHVFAVSPYGGTCGVRTHTQPRVVNRLSRFHRSAGLPIHAAAAKRASASPVGDGLSHGSWFPNPRLPPYPAPITASPLAQLRPTANIPTHTITRTSSGRQRLSSLSEDSGAAPLLARARFGLAASGGVSSAGAGLGRTAGPPVAALYLMAANGSLLHLLLHPRPLSTVPKEKICDDSPIELEVEPVAEWPLQRPPAAADLLAPLPPSNPLLQPCSRYAAQFRCADMCMSEEERWLSQVEIVTHAGPHRRLWMGPQFVFKTYNCTGSNSSLSEAETVEVEPNGGGVARSNPVNMPGVRPLVPVFVDSGSASSLEHSPSDSFRRKSLLAETGRAASVCDVQLREDLAEAMREDHGAAREDGGEAPRERRTGVARAVDPLGTVVQPSPTKAPTPDPDPELYVSSNCDEATFRPVVRAPAPLASRPEEAAYPLPHTTTIPVQNAASAVAPSTPPDPLPLSTAVVIPAALGAWPRLHLDADNSFNLDNLGNMCEIKDVRPSECLHNRNHKHLPESLPGSNETSSDVHPTAQPRIKRLSTPKSDNVTASDINSKDRKSTLKMSSKLEEESILKKVQKQPEIVIVENTEIFNPVSIVTETGKETSFVATREKIPSTESIKASNKETELKSSKIKVKVKTEEQSCNMLSNKQEKSVEFSSQIAVAGDKSFEETKLKLKKRSKVKKSQDDTQVKTDDDTFIEIHAIEESLQPPSNELVSISIPYDNTEPISYSGKSKKSRPAKSVTPARNDMVTCERKDSVNFESKEKVAMILETKEQEIVSCDEKNKVSSTFETQKQVEVDLVGKTREADFQFAGATNIWTTDTDIGTPQKLDLTKPIKNKNVDVTLNKTDISKCDIKSKNDIVTDKPKEVEKEKLKTNTLTVGEDAHEIVMTLKGSPKVKKSKSPSPYFERKLAEKRHEAEVTDVYVIDTVKEEFPEIQVTIGNKIRKQSPQSSKKCQDTEIVEKPVKTWSSIAASKHLKMDDKMTEVISKSVKHENKITKEHIEVEKKSDVIAKTTENRDYDKQVGSSTEVSLQEKLIELCKRRDIIVAECDAPSESTDLKFIEEHHSVLDLPPLEPLDFCLDDFKLDVMRDSLVDANDDTSPICKINIDSILSTIKDTTSKVTESRAFSLIDLENVPLKREQDFSVIENDNIIMQEVKLDEERDDKEEVMEKSSDDDITSPVVSTDSDKEDKKTGASNLTMPLSKQSSKSKKSRKKKK